ncbi:MAG: S1C family serine protease [Cyanobacteria bacterium J06560_6]
MDTIFETLSQDLANIVSQASRVVVSIKSQRSTSAGIHWRKGIIVTSCEAIQSDLQSDTHFKITLPDGQTVETELLGSDPTTDIAILSLPSTVDLPTAVLGDAQSLALGQLVSTVAYSSGRGRRRGRGGRRGRRTERSEGSMKVVRRVSSLGVVSELGDSWRSQSGGQIDQYIAIDINIRRGSAGCPLVNHSGQIVGFNTFGPQRRVLTIPAATVNRVVDQLQQRGKITRGYLGLGMQAIPLPENVRQQHELSNEIGIMVMSVEPESAADQAGMAIGDVMIAFGDETLESLRQLQTYLGPQSVGQPLPIKLLRGGQLQMITVTVGER